MSLKCLFSLALVAFLSSCATKKATVPTTFNEAAIVEEEQPISHITAEMHLAKAATLPSTLAIVEMIKASELYLIEQKPNKALWLAKQTQMLTQQPEQLYPLNLVVAQSYIKLNEIKLAYYTLKANLELTQKHSLKLSLPYYQTLAKVQEIRKQPIEALNALLYAFELNQNATAEDIDELWYQFSRFSTWQHQQLKKLSPPNIAGWSKLLNFANRFGSEPEKLQRYVNQWQREYSTHPAQHIATSLLVAPATKSTQNRIAVIIPLSGVQERAGKVAQQGILAAYQNDESLHFIDSNTLDMTTLAEKFATLEVDYVIGPLLKSNVKKYLAQTELTVPTLLLNLPSTPLKQNQVAISMRPEDEAIQAATTLSSNNYQHPIILSHTDNTSRRIAKTFSQQWQHITQVQPEIVFFDNDSKMQDQLKASLGVDLSQKRSQELNSRIKYSIKTEYRNRRDIDMIYIVGLPLEAKLLKPYIDVNISPFADIIPVFASSRSHSTKTDKSDKRDLAGLTFTAMPWQLPSKQQNKALAAQVKQLWPNRTDSLQNIFAMGYDSLTLINKISAMLDKTYIRHYGQTGVLRLDNDNILRRSLIWGKYSRNKVQEVAME